MKAFPHQFNDLSKLTDALRTFARLDASGADLSSDAVVGEAMARDGIYAFQNKDLTIEQALAHEGTKDRSNRGTHTAARDLRRFLRLCGFLASDSSTGTLHVTERGHALLASEDDATAHQHWRSAILALELEDNSGNVSHPYRILLRLVGDYPGLPTANTLLALEATDDSETEYAKVASYAYDDPVDVRDDLGITAPSARNAVKILPAIARQLGDIHTDNNKVFPRKSLLGTEDGVIQSAATPQNIGKKPWGLSTVVTDANGIARMAAYTETAATAVDLSNAIKATQTRTKLHQECVGSVAELLEAEGCKLYEHPFDCLAVQGDDLAVLIEMKTLDGSPGDERNQAQRALAQLAGYRYFNVPEAITQSARIVSVAAFSQPPSAPLVGFLRDNNIVVAAKIDNEWHELLGDGTSRLFKLGNL